MTLKSVVKDKSIKNLFLRDQFKFHAQYFTIEIFAWIAMMSIISLFDYNFLRKNAKIFLLPSWQPNFLVTSKKICVHINLLGGYEMKFYNL